MASSQPRHPPICVSGIPDPDQTVNGTYIDGEDIGRQFLTSDNKRIYYHSGEDTRQYKILFDITNKVINFYINSCSDINNSITIINFNYFEITY